MLSAIIASVLAAGALIGVALALLIYVQNALARLEVRLSASFFATRDTLTTSFGQLRAHVDAHPAIADLSARVQACELGAKQTSGTHLAAELAGLGAEVDKLARNMRKQFGAVWAELQHDGVLKRNEESQADLAETPEQTRARLRLKHGLPKLGGAANGAADEE